jgi:glucose/arabinose dehydrogenase/cytochrome c553
MNVRILIVLAALSSLGSFAAAVPPQEESSASKDAGTGADESKDSDVLPPNPGLGVGGHWGLVKDSDWIDRRWSKMDTGQIFCSTLGGRPRRVPKSMSIRVGEANEAAVCFDQKSLSVRVGWTGKFIEFGSKWYGLIQNPKVAGDVRFTFSGDPAWSKSNSRFEGVYLQGKRVVLSYTIDDCEILDSPWVESSDGLLAITRTFQLGPCNREIELRIADTGEGPVERSIAGDARILAIERDDGALAVAVRGWKSARLERAKRSPVSLRVPAHSETVRVKLLIWSGKKTALRSFSKLSEESPALEDLHALTRAGEPRWPHVLETKGTLSKKESPWVIDTIGVPFENPYKALMFLTGLDFFANGDAAVCTIHGDVWLVRGIDDDLEKITWKRFATGLYQPFGVRIVDEKVYIIGRDQISILHDRNRDDEAEYYENFSGAWDTIPWPHQFNACLQTDSEGNFYFVNPAGVHRVSKDGSSVEILARGWRNPAGMSVGPDGTIIVAPQEGEWTPASQICEVKHGGFYGYKGPRKSATRPLGYDPPLCYIPRHVDSSSGGQVWVTSDRWGPLEGQLVCFSYGRCSMQMVLRETVDGVPQGGVVPLRGRFRSGVIRGRFHPKDGQLYVTGTTGWVTSATADGCFERVRYTGKKVYLPIGIHAHANGLRIEFSQPLEREVAEDPASYAVEQWSYRYTKNYGSDEYSIRHPKKIGHDPVRIRSAHLLEDGKSVFLEIPTIHPVMQMHVNGSLEAADGSAVPFDIFNTIHRLRPELEIEERSDDSLVEAIDLEPVGEPGLILRLESVSSQQSDTRVSRLAALSVPSKTPPSPFLDSGPFRASFSGDLNLDERGRVVFSAEGRGELKLSVDDIVLLEGRGDDLSKLGGNPTLLRRGARRLRLEYTPPKDGDAWMRLYWSGPGFARETIPPGVFTHDPKTPDLVHARELRRGRELFAERRCAKCHAARDADALREHGMPELQRDGPSFRGIGLRLHTDWIASWILDPASHRASATMPSLAGLLEPNLSAADLDGRARDIAAFLATCVGDGKKPVPPRDDSATLGGQLFEMVGCIACHILPGTRENDPDRVPLRHVARKWKTGALRDFLLAPGRHYRWTRMPDFKLSEKEAVRVAEFLRKQSNAATESEPRGTSGGPAGDAERGKRWVQSSGCLSCHELPAQNRLRSPSLEALAGVDWSHKGCVAQVPGSSPRLGLSATERAALQSFGAKSLSSLRRRNLAEFSQRRVRDLRCVACHSRDKESSRWAEVRDETKHLAPPRKKDSFSEIPGIVVQTVPTLTLTGDKLRTDWLRRFIGGELPYELRPWLDARMPRFPVAADLLAQGISLDHGWPLDPPDAFVAPASASSETVRAGARLLTRSKGFGCYACHASGKRPAEMKLYFGAINLQHSRERLRREFYLRWTLNPQRVEPLSPMPAYTDQDGVTPFTDIFEGVGERQYSAIWEYLGTVR